MSSAKVLSSDTEKTWQLNYYFWKFLMTYRERVFQGEEENYLQLLAGVSPFMRRTLTEEKF